MSVAVKDDLGRLVMLPRPAARVVSLTPDVTENLFAIGAGRTVVGVTTADDYPPQVRAITKVGGFGQPDYERVRALQPDLVVAASGTITADEATLLMRKFGGVPIFVQKEATVADVPRHLLQLGALTGRETEARRAAAQMTATVAAIVRKAARLPRVTVFVEISASPLYAAGPGSLLNDMVRLAGGVNVVKGANPYPMVSKEALLAADPQVYIISAAPGEPASAYPANLPASLAARLQAVRNRAVIRIPSDLLDRSTPRLVQGLALLARALHPTADKRG